MKKPLDRSELNADISIADDILHIANISRRAFLKDLAVRSNSSKSSGLKSRPRNCPYALVV